MSAGGNSLSKYGVELPYLQARLQKQLDSLETKKFLVEQIRVMQPASSDVATLNSNKIHVLAIIVGKGQRPLATSLLNEVSGGKDLHLILDQIWGAGPARGVTVKRLSIVGTAALGLVGLEKENRELLSNTLIHEVGHALLPSVSPGKVHDTGGVMRPTLAMTDGELGYSQKFKNLLNPPAKSGKRGSKKGGSK